MSSANQQTQFHYHGGGFFPTTAAAAAAVNHLTTTSAAGIEHCRRDQSGSLKRRQSQIPSPSPSSSCFQEPTPKKINLHGFSRIALPLANPIEPSKHSLHRTFSGPGPGPGVDSSQQPSSIFQFLNPLSPPENALASASPSPPPFSSIPPPIPRIVNRRAVSEVTSPDFQQALRSIELPENVCRTSASPSPPPSASQPPIPTIMRRAMSDVTSPGFQQALNTTTPPLERTISLTPSCNSDSSTRGKSPSFERVKIMDEMAKEISEWCEEAMHQMQQIDDGDEEVQEDGSDDNNPQEEEAAHPVEEVEAGSEDNNHQEPQEEEEEEEEEKAVSDTQEEVSVDRVGDCLTIHFACPCGKGYQVLLSGKNCYYKLVPYQCLPS